MIILLGGIYSRNIAWRFPTDYLSERCDSPFILSGVLLDPTQASQRKPRLFVHTPIRARLEGEPQWSKFGFGKYSDCARVQGASQMHGPAVAGYKKITIRNHGSKIDGRGFEDLSGSRVQSIDVDEYHRVNDERYKYFKTDLPISALIVVKRLAHEDLIVEIKCVAVIPTERFKPTNSND
jgi:hypothetical protein